MISTSFIRAVLLLGLVPTLGCSPGPGYVTARWESLGTPIKVRVLRLSELHGGVVPGAYYRFEAALEGLSDWHEVMTFRHDDPVEIPKDQFRVINARLAYAFMGWMYAVTTDGGRTWSVWDAGVDLPDWKCCNYGLIRDVELNPSGAGLMRLQVIRGRPGEVPELSTADFGRHWKPRGG